MRRNGILLSRENAAHRGHVRAEIGRRLREEYGLAQPMPDRLTELVGKFEARTAVELRL